MSDTSPRELHPLYEKILRDIIDGFSLDVDGIYQISNALQALKYFFTFACENAIPPEKTTIETVKAFALRKHLAGCNETTLHTYLQSLRRYHLDLAESIQEEPITEAEICKWIVIWEKKGLRRGSKPERRSEYEVTYAGETIYLKSIHSTCHPRG